MPGVFDKEHTRRGDELAQKRQELPWVRVDKGYRFETEEGSALLSDLFRGRSQLLVYHLMFGPDYTASTYARGLDGLWGMWQWLDRAPNGRNATNHWWRRHDEYDNKRG